MIARRESRTVWPLWEALCALILYLPFLAIVHQFNANQSELSRLKGLEPEHRTCHPLHSSMILLNDIMQRFHLTDYDKKAALL